jgi:hypothetical protein
MGTIEKAIRTITLSTEMPHGEYSFGVNQCKLEGLDTGLHVQAMTLNLKPGTVNELIVETMEDVAEDDTCLVKIEVAAKVKFRLSRSGLMLAIRKLHDILDPHWREEERRYPSSPDKWNRITAFTSVQKRDMGDSALLYHAPTLRYLKDMDTQEVRSIHSALKEEAGKYEDK